MRNERVTLYLKISGVLCVLLLGGFLRYTGAFFSLPLVDHPNEPHYTFTAAGYEEPEYARPEMKGYPPGIIWINSLALRFFHIPGDNPAEVIPYIRFFAVFFSLGTMLLIILTCYESGHYISGITAGLVYAISPVMVEYDRYGVAEPFQCFFMTLTFYSLFAYIYRKKRLFIYLAYVAGVCALLFKYPAGILLLPVVLTDIFFTAKRGAFPAVLFREKGFIIRLSVLTLFVVWLLFGYGAFSLEKYPEWSWRRHTVFHGFTLITFKTFMNNIWNIIITPTNFLDFNSGPPYTGWKGANTSLLFSLLLFVYALPGFIMEFRKGKFGDMWGSVFLLPLLFTALLSFFTPAYRHFIPVFPLYCILLGIGGVGTTSLIYRSARFRSELAAVVSSLLFPAMIAFLAFRYMLIPSLENMSYRSKPDVRNDIAVWMSSELPAGNYISTLDFHALFLEWSGYSGKKYFRCVALLRESDPPPTPAIIARLHAAYIVVPLKMYTRWEKQHQRHITCLKVLGSFESGGKYVPRSYIILFSGGLLRKAGAKLD